MIRVLSFLCAMILASCSTTPQPPQGTASIASRLETVPMRVFSGSPSRIAIRRSNVDVANEFMDLAFALESGQNLSQFTRFEGPITVAFRQTPHPQSQRDLEALVSRLRAEAGLPIRALPPGSEAKISINMVTQSQLGAIVPNAACFVIPNVSSYADLIRLRRSPTINWTTIATRDSAGVFIPETVSLQDVRDCLHEEIAQALGPLNDLYRLPDSVFNDDNFHVVLTSYDMLILRVYYHAELRNGMRRLDVSSRILSILNRVNPAGSSYASRNRQKTSREWVELIEGSFGARGGNSARLRRIDRAIALAQQNYGDHRLGFALFGRARLNVERRPELAAVDYKAAYDLYRGQLGRDDIHAATVALQLASLAYFAEDFPTALRYLDRAIPAARAGQNAALLFRLLAVKSVIKTAQGSGQEGAEILREAIGWGKYGLASEREILEVIRIVGQLGS